MKTSRIAGLLSTIGLGAGLMYLFDPEKGRSRRSLTFDKLRKTGRQGSRKITATGRDLGHRAKGLAATGKQRFEKEQVPDGRLVERVRAEMGHHVSNAHALTVSAMNGRITLSGPVLQSEVDELLSAVSSVPGVREVESRLEVGEQPTTGEPSSPDGEAVRLN